MKHLSDITVLVLEQSCWFLALVHQNIEEWGIMLHNVHKIATCPSIQGCMTQTITL